MGARDELPLLCTFLALLLLRVLVVLVKGKEGCEWGERLVCRYVCVGENGCVDRGIGRYACAFAVPTLEPSVTALSDTRYDSTRPSHSRVARILRLGLAQVLVCTHALAMPYELRPPYLPKLHVPISNNNGFGPRFSATPHSERHRHRHISGLRSPITMRPWLALRLTRTQNRNYARITTPSWTRTSAFCASVVPALYLPPTASNTHHPTLV